ncbi:MAG: preprotein translocase subunit YajC, partial [Muribaculaceae bacterium]|nr:preprotein translocase subunit YajC [Muribaculaceae bacterium]
MLYNLIPLDVQGAGASNIQGILMIVLMIAIFYFMMIRPQQKKQKEMRKFRDNIQKGDNVISAGGIYGKVKEVRNDGSIIMSIADGVTI